MKTAICYLSCDRPELVRQTLPVLVDDARRQRFHLFIADGSVTKSGRDAVWEIGYPTATTHSNIRGGAGAAIVYALTWMLDHVEQYDYVGLVETDVLLTPDWFEQTMNLFPLGRADGLVVGAASARSYEDRILVQCNDQYAVMHNVGAGHVVFTRDAARLVLDNFRTGWTTDNRRVFAQLSGIDIGTYWAFRTNEHPLTADWHWETVLAAHGLATLALTPSLAVMVGQNPPLSEQGLVLVSEPVEARRDDKAFAIYRNNLAHVRDHNVQLATELQFHYEPTQNLWTVFPHQMMALDGQYLGDWRLKEARGWGTFAWVAVNDYPTPVGTIRTESVKTSLTISAFGPIALLVSGGQHGGSVEVVDEASGYRATPKLDVDPDGSRIAQIVVPGGTVPRTIRLTALSDGVVFYGVQSREQQPRFCSWFNHAVLPPP